MWAISVTQDELIILGCLLTPMVAALGVLFRALMKSIETARTDYIAAMSELQKTFNSVSSNTVSSNVATAEKLEDAIDKVGGQVVELNELIRKEPKAVTNKFKGETK